MKLNRRLAWTFFLWVFLESVSIPFVVSLSSSDSVQQKAVSVVSWNLLAPMYALPAKYPWSAPEDIDWKFRKSRILSRLACIDADIVCLQEVQVAFWDELKDKMREDLDYDEGILQKMGRNHPVANAILIKRDCPLRVVRTESRSRVLIAVLQDDKEKSSPPLYLANVHLEAGMKEDDVRLSQLRSLCKRVKRLVAADDEEHPAVVFCGDFNLIQGSPLYNFLQTGAYITQSDTSSIHTEIHSPLLPLRDAYLECAPRFGQVPEMSFRSGHILDYFWVSNAVEVLQTMPMGDAVTVAEPKNWPSRENPSDHVPTGALLSWAGAPLTGAARRRAPWH